ncbi:hypothetical protein J6W34_00245 [bacterium]|nr:hypothetical protein [bacterium]
MFFSFTTPLYNPWCIIGGTTRNTEYGSNGTSITLPISYNHSNYVVYVTQLTPRRDGMGSTVIPGGYVIDNNHIFICGRYVVSNESCPLNWLTFGYIT